MSYLSFLEEAQTEIDSPDWEKAMSDGMHAFDDREWSTAFTAFNLAISVSVGRENTVPALCWRGITLSMTDQDDAALADMNGALEEMNGRIPFALLHFSKVNFSHCCLY